MSPVTRGGRHPAPAIPATVDAYVSACAPDARDILERLRILIAEEAPGVVERISYRMPAFALGGILLYVGAFKTHIGLYPPLTATPGMNDLTLLAELALYRGEKGNLKFPLSKPFPDDLVRRIVRARVAMLAAKHRAKKPSAARSRA